MSAAETLDLTPLTWNPTCFSRWSVLRHLKDWALCNSSSSWMLMWGQWWCRPGHYPIISIIYEPCHQKSFSLCSGSDSTLVRHFTLGWDFNHHSLSSLSHSISLSLQIESCYMTLNLKVSLPLWTSFISSSQSPPATNVQCPEFCGQELKYSKFKVSGRWGWHSVCILSGHILETETSRVTDN